MNIVGSNSTYYLVGTYNLYFMQIQKRCKSASPSLFDEDELLVEEIIILCMIYLILDIIRSWFLKINCGRAFPLN